MGCTPSTVPQFCSAVYNHYNQAATQYRREQDLLGDLRVVDGTVSSVRRTGHCYLCLCRGERLYFSYAVPQKSLPLQCDELCGARTRLFTRVCLQRPLMTRDNHSGLEARMRALRCCSECNQRMLTQFCAERLHCLSKLPLPRDVCLRILASVWDLLTHTSEEIIGESVSEQVIDTNDDGDDCSDVY